MENKPSGKRRVPRKSDLAVLRWLWHLSRGQGLKFAVLIICNVLTGAASVVFAGLSKGIIDSAVEYADLNRVLQYALYLLLLLLLQLALHLTGRSVEERLKARLEIALKGHMLKQILQKDYAAVSAYHTGDLQNRMFNDVRVVSDSFATLLPGVLAMLTRLLCAFIYLLQLDMGFALVFLAAGCVVAVCSQLFRKTIKRLHKKVQESEGKTVAVIGDSTFMHSGMTGLANIAYNQSNSTVIILDNSITGMTGHQQNPTTGYNIKGDPAGKIDLEALCKAMGFARVVVVDPYDLAQCDKVLKEELAAPEPSVIISRRPCVLLKYVKHNAPLKVDTEKCIGCKSCMRLGCPAISIKDGKAAIDATLCVGCGVCEQLCRFDAL